MRLLLVALSLLPAAFAFVLPSGAPQRPSLIARSTVATAPIVAKKSQSKDGKPGIRKSFPASVQFAFLKVPRFTLFYY